MRYCSILGPNLGFTWAVHEKVEPFCHPSEKFGAAATFGKHERPFDYERHAAVDIVQW